LEVNVKMDVRKMSERERVMEWEREEGGIYEVHLAEDSV
jgi:hypothetical protein